MDEFDNAINFEDLKQGETGDFKYESCWLVYSLIASAQGTHYFVSWELERIRAVIDE